MGKASTADIQSVEGKIIMPFYIVCDVSWSMTLDNAIGALNDALKQLHEDVMADFIVDDLTMLSVISFNSSARTEVALDKAHTITLPTLSADGGTDYGAAFHELYRAIEADRSRLKGQGRKVYRPCVFFLSDGEPDDGDYLATFTSLFGYDPATQRGNKAFPYVVTYGFRDATPQTISSIAYPDFGNARGRWFVAKQGSDITELMASFGAAITNTILTVAGAFVGPFQLQIAFADESLWQSDQSIEG